ncbi:hypothetical protein FNV64_18735 [Streptomyces sp. S1A1-7]|uniref:hypothetical protein n=1 Tax=Streptomyces sp. S1A1-7 TaxID=2594459 RepID=UPI0011648F71|nr:hypothetical protein [Streptomyces sp. S1A1-7]QDN77360.1 hypothetical protein FNV64_18735 [Streptomyces sp. S1A1-7]
MAAPTGPAPGSRRTLGGALTDLYRSRGLLLGLLAVAVGIILMITMPQETVYIVRDAHGQYVINKSADTLQSRLHLFDIGNAIFQTGLVIVLFQVLLNQIADDRFVEQVRSVMDTERELVREAVVRSMAVGRHINSLELSPAELDRVIESAVRLRSGSSELGSVVARKLRLGVFDSEEIWHNLVVRAEILELERATPGGREHDYYGVYFQFGYHTNNTRRTRFSFKVATWGEEYDRTLRAHDLGGVWRLPSSGEFDTDWADGFSLTSVSFAGRSVPVGVNEAEREFFVHVPVDEFEDAESIRVQYSFMAKVRADGNLLSFEVPRPTFGANYSVSLGVNDIESIRALDYFGATRPASIDYSPGLATTRVVSVSIDDWILPKAGMVLVWKRRSVS